MKKSFVLIVFIWLSFTLRPLISNGQIQLSAIPLDSIILETHEFIGEIQWQWSDDNDEWMNIDGATFNPFQVQLTTVPSYFRAAISEIDCEQYYSQTLVIENDIPTFYWSDSSAWDNQQIPQSGDQVVIPTGRKIVLNVNTPQLESLTIDGILEFQDKDLTLTSKWIMVHGEFLIGSEEHPFNSKAVITLNDSNTDANIMNMGTRGIMVMGGKLALYGSHPNVVWSKIDQHAEVGSNSIQLVEEADWKIGDEIVIAPTDYYLAGGGSSVTQKTTITAISGNGDGIGFSEGLNAFRWGLLQYPTNSGMSLNQDNTVQAPLPDTETMKTPLVLDERAEVGNLTRNIVIQAPNDDAWNNLGFGVHVMVMGPNSEAYLDGVEIRRGGQRNRLGRYPFHWHMLSYSGSQTLNDATGQFIKNSTINSSRNRGIVIHGTNGVVAQKNIVYDVRGHGIFTEDAVERRNVIDSNLVLHVRNPPFGLALKQHEAGERGSSGFWISNPDNIITNNTAADCGTNGFWLAFTDRPWGESSSVLADDGLLLNPSRLLFGVFDNNTAHSNGMEGINLDLVEADEEGNVKGFIYSSTTDGRNGEWPFPNRRRFTLANFSVWKNGLRGLWDSSIWPDSYGGVSADNCERFFAGRGTDGIVERCLVVGTSLNHLMNGTDRPFHNFANFHNNGESVGTPVAFATYHSTFDIKGNIIIDFGDAIANTWSGAFATDDYYERPVEKGMYRNPDNLFINSHPGVKLKAFGDYFTLASALWDPQGYWGPAENYFVYDDPFLTYGKEITQVAPNAEIAGGVSVAGPFYGFVEFVLHGIGDTPPQNQPYMDLMGIHVKRFDQEFNQVATWDVQPALQYYTLNHMRDFAASPDGIYELAFSWLNPENYPQYPTNFRMDVENMLSEEDQLVIGIQFDGSLNPTVGMRSHPLFYPYQQLGSLQEVIDSQGETWWQDNENNKVWVKIRGGRWAFWTDDSNVDAPTSNDLLYETTQLMIFVSND